ncbi:hypothetical protein DJ62_3880 [Yersinia enterocolitica]|nr:hypothetical protein DJ62_3880 [Yersinia enterocolitica]
MQLRDAIDRKAADHAQIGHPHLLIMVDCQLGPNLFIARPLLIDQLLKLRIDLLDDDKMTRQQAAHQFFIPALKGFWHQGVVGISEGFTGDRPSRIYGRSQ